MDIIRREMSFLDTYSAQMYDVCKGACKWHTIMHDHFCFITCIKTLEVNACAQMYWRNESVYHHSKVPSYSIHHTSNIL